MPKSPLLCLFTHSLTHSLIAFLFQFCVPFARYYSPSPPTSFCLRAWCIHIYIIFFFRNNFLCAISQSRWRCRANAIQNKFIAIMSGRQQQQQQQRHRDAEGERERARQRACEHKADQNLYVCVCVRAALA